MWSLFILSINSITSTTSYTSSLPKPNRDFLAKHKTPIKRTFPQIQPNDPEYKTKMNAQCKEILTHLKKDYDLGFSGEIRPNQYVDVPPVRIHVREDTTPFLATTARNYPIGREDKCKAVISQLKTSGVIRMHDKVTTWYTHGFFVPKLKGGLRL